MSLSLDAVVWSGFLGLLLTSVWTDVKDLRIPNVLPATLAVLFLIAGLFTPDFNWLSHLGAGALVLGVGVALFAMGKVGGGDVKLLAAVALWVGFAHLLPLALVMGVCGGGVALLFLVLRRSGIGFLFASKGFPLVSLEDGKGVPYGMAIAAAAVLLLPKIQQQFF